MRMNQDETRSGTETGQRGKGLVASLCCGIGRQDRQNLSRKAMAEKVNIDWRYLANIENDGTIPSLPVIIQLIRNCGLPVERYFNPEIMREESEQRQRVSHKLKLCPEEYLTIIEGAIDGAIKIEQPKKKETEDA